MSTPSERLAHLGLLLPEPAAPSFDYVPVTEHAGVLYVSGQLPKEDGEVRITGRLGAEVGMAEAEHAARVCVLQGLACAAAHVGGLDNIDRVLRISGFVASTPDFHQQPKVIDAASNLVGQIFGPKGRHARSAIGVAALPRKSPVEIEFILTETVREAQQ
ncbi:LysR family transcriptional regulator [Mycolicibacterium murale]|uniref:LysR family transcriptional regulator n=1 Tax=Mycolicibacterium murale TaxID=182220 RepID=A0A7I9WWG0_9MYCO|nr:RidA family protein [Mycolicibacterium murale]ANW63001.1 LysR family transcriptional regulator [Mycobacterium sp. djl-10]MCV7180957.1 RidA family protein [Mycolicibacterium murale]GFG61929.1 LysR family transcriptional regulator [Mycolicibacterium murale]